MQSHTIGNVIRTMRLNLHMTQKELGDLMNISDKTISKWECNQGLPDISLISQLSDILGVDIKKLLKGTIVKNDFVSGNLRNTKFFVCPECHNITLCTGNAEVVCCGRQLHVQTLKKAGESEMLSVQVIDDDWYITSSHPMTKAHYISFVASITGDHLHVIKQYPEWNLGVSMPKKGHVILLWYCTKHGMFYQIV